MKKVFRISGVILLFLSIFLIQTTGQEKGSRLFTIDVGGKSIVIPSPENNLAEVGDTIRKKYEFEVPKEASLKAVFLPNDFIQKFGIEPTSGEKEKVLVMVYKDFDNKELSEKDFVDLMKSITSTLPSDLPQYFKDANKINLKLKDAIEKQEVGTPVFLGTALDIKDAFAFLMSIKSNTNNGLQKVLAGSLYIRLKNKVLVIYIYNYQESEESLAWICNTIQTWSKSLFELNKDLSPVTKSSSSNANQNADNSVFNPNSMNYGGPLITFLPIIILVTIGLLIFKPIIKRDRKQPHSDQTNLKYASFWLRLLAFCVDWVILSTIFCIIVILFSVHLNEEYVVAHFGILVLYRGPIVLLIGWAYYAILESSKLMATFGKLLVKIKVTDYKGNRITLWNAIVRYFGKIISGLFLGMGFLMIFFMSKRQAFHDNLAKTYVILKQNPISI